MLGLGFSAGLPNPLVGDTLKAWLSTEGVSLGAIGLYSLVHLPYNLKFVWAPLFDRYRLPFLSRRRDWMIVAQLGVLVSVGVLGSLDPVAGPFWVALLAVVVAFFSASQDISIDAYRTDLLPATERAKPTAVFVATYRVALIVSGAGALILADHLPWTVIYWMVAGLMGVGILTTLLAPAPPEVETTPKTLVEAVVEPIREVLKRDRAAALLAVVMLYRVGDVVASQLLTKFLLDLDFSLTDIGALRKGLGLGATIVGSLLGGGLAARWGLRRSMIAIGAMMGLANLLYVALAVVGKSYTLLSIAVTADNLMTGMGTMLFVQFLMSLCNKKMTATQYALFSSLMTVPGLLLASVSGFLAEAVGYPIFFVITVVAAFPALVLLRTVPLDDPLEHATEA